MNLYELLDGQEYGLFIGPAIYAGAPPKKALIDQILYEKDVICISAKAGVGKSVLLQQLLCCLTTGTPFLDTFEVPKPCNVLYIQTEGDRSETIERLELMQKRVPIDNDRWAHLNLPGFCFNDDEQVDQLIALIKERFPQVEVIELDPLYTTIKGSMNDSEVVTHWIRNVRKLKGIFNASMIISNHVNKEFYNEGAVVERDPGSIFGSTFWAAFFNHSYRLKIFEGHHLLEIGKNRSGKAIDKIAMTMLNTNTLMYTLYEPDLTDNGAKIVALLRSSKLLSAKQIIEVTGVKRATAFRIIKGLVDKAEVRRVHCPVNGELITMLSDDDALLALMEMSKERAAKRRLTIANSVV